MLAGLSGWSTQLENADVQKGEPMNTTPEPEMRRYLQIIDLQKSNKEFEQKVDRYQQALVQIAAGVSESEAIALATKALIG